MTTALLSTPDFCTTWDKINNKLYKALFKDKSNLPQWDWPLTAASVRDTDKVGI